MIQAGTSMAHYVPSVTMLVKSAQEGIQPTTVQNVVPPTMSSLMGAVFRTPALLSTLKKLQMRYVLPVTMYVMNAMAQVTRNVMRVKAVTRQFKELLFSALPPAQLAIIPVLLTVSVSSTLILVCHPSCATCSTGSTKTECDTC